MYLNLPQYFKTHAPAEIYDNKKSPYAWAHGLEGKTYYEAIASVPERAEMFNRSMSQFEDMVPTLGMYPFSALKEQVQADPDRPFIVDVGGSHGSVLMSIQEEAPAGFGSQMILQDRPDVIAEINQDDIPNITKMGHDFFTPNPIKSQYLLFASKRVSNLLTVF